MKDLFQFIILLVSYGIFKYAIYYLADLVDMDKQRSLIPGYDIAVFFKYINMPLWTLALLICPVVNGFFLLYLLCKKREIFLYIFPLFGPILLFKDVRELYKDELNTTFDKIMVVIVTIFKIMVYLTVGIFLLCGGIILVFIFNAIMKRIGWEVLYWSALIDLLRF